MKLLRAADRVAVPWKNGGGLTREVAAYPPGASMDELGWRISIADVATAGPFSSFAGVDRILTVLDGRLLLRFADGQSVDLAPGEPFAFPGNVAVHGTPLEGPVRDLNVMTRRGEWRACVSRWRLDLPTDGLRAAVATASAPGIAALDVLLLDAGENPPAGFEGYLIRIEATA